MSTSNLKIGLINRIAQLKENYVIDEIDRMLDFELEEGSFKLNSKQKARILEGREEYKAGKVLTEKEANKQIQEWLSK
ncbi:MAG: hypothetical protein ABIW47_12520 [Ginsengibacter sp.]|jgi:superfamily II DNA/RNA helicase